MFPGRAGRGPPWKPYPEGKYAGRVEKAGERFYNETNADAGDRPSPDSGMKTRGAWPCLEE